MVKIMENPMNKWMIWGPPLFLETPILETWTSCPRFVFAMNFLLQYEYGAFVLDPLILNMNGLVKFIFGISPPNKNSFSCHVKSTPSSTGSCKKGLMIESIRKNDNYSKQDVYPTYIHTNTYITCTISITY